MILRIGNGGGWSPFPLEQLFSLDRVSNAFDDHPDFKDEMHGLVTAIDVGRWQLGEVSAMRPEWADFYAEQHKMGVYAIECEIVVEMAARGLIYEHEFTVDFAMAKEHEDRFFAFGRRTYSKEAMGDTCASCRHFRCIIEDGEHKWKCVMDGKYTISLSDKACGGEWYAKW
jgi:hypothetical protein